MSQALTVSSPSNFNEGVGLSDEEELRRFALAQQNQPVGEEILVDMSDDLRELGIDVS